MVSTEERQPLVDEVTDYEARVDPRASQGVRKAPTCSLSSRDFSGQSNGRSNRPAPTPSSPGVGSSSKQGPSSRYSAWSPKPKLNYSGRFNPAPSASRYGTAASASLRSPDKSQSASASAASPDPTQNAILLEFQLRVAIVCEKKQPQLFCYNFRRRLSKP